MTSTALVEMKFLLLLNPCTGASSLAGTGALRFILIVVGGAAARQEDVTQPQMDNVWVPMGLRHKAATLPCRQEAAWADAVLATDTQAATATHELARWAPWSEHA